VLLQNVTALSIPQQITLNDWIDEGLGQAQVLSITTTPLWQLVQNGDFLEGLFYRLNVVCLDAAPRLTQMH
jgi:transcriptional regulator of aromatic amino acid metabolism